MAFSSTEYDFELSVVNKLIDAGYPKDAIVTDWRSKNRRIDVVVLDVDTKIPLMIIECKTMVRECDFNSLVNQLRTYSNALNCPVKTLAAVELGTNIAFYDLTNEVNGNSQTVSGRKPVSIQSYDSLRIGAESKYINAQKQKRKTYINGLKFICWGIIPTLVIMFFLLDALSVYCLTTERLILFGGLLLSILLPFFGEIKVGDITLSNEKKSKDKSSI